MSEKQEVTCIKPCWDSSTTTYYTFGNKAMIDPEAPVAQYFDGWSPGTVVYNKTRGVLGGKEPQIAARKVAESFVGKKGKKEDAKADEVPPVDEF